MYDLTLGQNGHFNQNKSTKKIMFISCPMFLIKAYIFSINVNILVKLNL
jgi:hypothetical protein